MESQDDSQVNNEVQPQPQLQPQLQTPRIEDTAIVEYLDIIRREYEIERAKGIADKFLCCVSIARKITIEKDKTR